MSTKRNLQLPPPTNSAGGTAIGQQFTIDLPLGYRYHEIALCYVDGTGAPTDILALISDFIIYRNGIPQRTHTAAELDHLNGLNGSQYQRQQIGAGANMRQTQTLFLAEPWRKSKTDTDAMAWSADAANGFRTFQIKGTFLVAMPAGAAFFVSARVDAPLAPPKGGAALKKVYRQQIPASGASNDVVTLDERDGYQTICMKQPATSNILNVTLKNNDVTIIDTLNSFDNISQLTGMGLNPATGTAASAFGFDLVLDADDPILSALPATSTGAGLWLHLAYTPGTAATGNVVALIERFGPLD
jgi:hypothetical protein